MKPIDFRSTPCPHCEGTGALRIGPDDPVFGPDMEACQDCYGTGDIEAEHPRMERP